MHLLWIRLVFPIYVVAWTSVLHVMFVEEYSYAQNCGITYKIVFLCIVGVLIMFVGSDILMLWDCYSYVHSFMPLHVNGTN